MHLHLRNRLNESLISFAGITTYDGVKCQFDSFHHDRVAVGVHVQDLLQLLPLLLRVHVVVLDDSLLK